jgi:hypothetical protein
MLARGFFDHINGSRSNITGLAALRHHTSDRITVLRRNGFDHHY